MKKKILTIAVFSVMVLTVIGLAVGLVLVAGRASMNNVMQISYVSNNVGARITAYGILYPNATGTENGVAIPTADGNDSETVEFYEDQEDANGNISFQTVTVTDTSRAVYTFNVTNTTSSTNTKELKAMITFNNLQDTDNVDIQVGTSESSTTTISATYNQYYINIGAGQQYKTIVVTMRVADPAKDIKDFNANMQIELGYDIENTTPFNWGTETVQEGQFLLGIDNKSSASFTIGGITVASGERNTKIQAFNSGDEYAWDSGITYTPSKTTDYSLSLKYILPDGSTGYTTQDKLITSTNEFENTPEPGAGLFLSTFGVGGYMTFGTCAWTFDKTEWTQGTKVLIEITDAE